MPSGPRQTIGVEWPLLASGRSTFHCTRPVRLFTAMMYEPRLWSQARIDEIADDDRRGAHAVDVVERAERHRPALLARGVVGDEAVVGEEDVDAVGFDRRARRRRVVALVDDLGLDLRRGALPEDACPSADRSRSSRACRRGRPSGRCGRCGGSATSVLPAAPAARGGSSAARTRSARWSPSRCPTRSARGIATSRAPPGPRARCSG